MALATPLQREMLGMLASMGRAPEAMAAVCFDDDAEPEVVWAFNDLLGAERFQEGERWEGTATDGFAGSRGDPKTLTYSFVPDGTTIASGAGEGSAPNDLFASLNGIYGSPAQWRPIFEEVFQRWGELSGLTFVYEPNDDGALVDSNPLTAPGVLGVRGDIRITGKPVDGTGGILAYNYFPDFGAEMVIDTTDAFYDNTDSESLRLRNVIAHELGHGLGARHICPVQRSALMQPIASVSFVGPQHDDVRFAQTLYGDAFEPNDSRGAATDLGLIEIGGSVDVGAAPEAMLAGTPGPETPFLSLLSLDNNGDNDYFRFEVPARCRVTIVATPVGFEYRDNIQSGGCGNTLGSCCSTQFTDSEAIADLSFQVQRSNGSLVYLSGAPGLGQPEVADGVLLTGAGEYFVRVLKAPTMNEAQLYTLRIEVEDEVRGPLLAVAGTAPEVLAPGLPTPVTLAVTPRDDLLLLNSVTLWWRVGGGTFLPVPMQQKGGGLYHADIPASECAGTTEYFFSATSTQAGVTTLPAAGGGGPLRARIGETVVVAAHDFETQPPGWSSTGDASDGLWDRGEPVSCTVNTLPSRFLSFPATDFDGSGKCFLTDNSAFNFQGVRNCDSDVDAGEAVLETGVYDLSPFESARLRYARLFDTTSKNSGAAEDAFVIEADDGSGWTTLETVGPTVLDDAPHIAGRWMLVEHDLGASIGLTDQVRFRFVARDLGLESVVEAGVDAFALEGFLCDFMPPCIGDASADGQVSFSDLTSVLLHWGAEYPALDPETSGPGDADFNGVVDFGDVTAVLENWLVLCP